MYLALRVGRTMSGMELSLDAANIPPRAILPHQLSAFLGSHHANRGRKAVRIDSTLRDHRGLHPAAQPQSRSRIDNVRISPPLDHHELLRIAGGRDGAILHVDVSRCALL